MGFADNHFTLTADHCEMLTANCDDTVTASHTESHAIVKMAISLLRHDYYMAEIFRVLRKEIDLEFGPNLRELRQHSYTADQYALFEERQREQAGFEEGQRLESGQLTFSDHKPGWALMTFGLASRRPARA